MTELTINLEGFDAPVPAEPEILDKIGVSSEKYGPLIEQAMREKRINELWRKSERRFKSQLEADDYDNLEQVMLLAYNGDDYAVSLTQWYKNMCDFWDARNEGDSYTENQHAWALRNIPKFEEVGE